jgi:hypothetical protein
MSVYRKAYGRHRRLRRTEQVIRTYPGILSRLAQKQQAASKESLAKRRGELSSLLF